MARVDRSLLDEWQRIKTGALVVSEVPDMPPDPRAADKALKARVRVEALALLQAIAAGALDDAAAMLAPDADGQTWTAERLAAFLAPLTTDGALVFDHRSRLADACTLRSQQAGVWEATLTLQTADGPTGDTLTVAAHADQEALQLSAQH